MERKVLGKGLEALIPKKIERETRETEKEFLYLPTEKILPGPFQPRREISPSELEELANSIKEKGIIQPIVVRKRGEKYEVVAGNRRFQAAKLLKIKSLPVIIRPLNNQEAFLYALIENLQRKDLNPLEEAQALQRLNEEFKLSYQEIAQMIGKNKAWVANTLRLLKLPEEIKEGLRKGVLSRSQARTILGVEDPQRQRSLFYKIIKQGLSVRELEARVRKISSRRRKESPFVVEIEERLKRSLGTKVKIYNRKNNSGKIIIEYYNLNDLERITEKLDK